MMNLPVISCVMPVVERRDGNKGDLEARGPLDSVGVLSKGVEESALWCGWLYTLLWAGVVTVWAALLIENIAWRPCSILLFRLTDGADGVWIFWSSNFSPSIFVATVWRRVDAASIGIENASGPSDWADTIGKATGVTIAEVCAVVICSWAFVVVEHTSEIVCSKSPLLFGVEEIEQG